jgi:hypothetical protein
MCKKCDEELPSAVQWYMLPDSVVEELRTARMLREEKGDSPNAGDVQRLHLRVQRALEALGDAVLGKTR